MSQNHRDTMRPANVKCDSQSTVVLGEKSTPNKHMQHKGEITCQKATGWRFPTAKLGSHNMLLLTMTVKRQTVCTF